MPYGIERKIRISMEEKIDPRITNLIKAYEKTLDNIDLDIERTKEQIEKEFPKVDIDRLTFNLTTGDRKAGKHRINKKKREPKPRPGYPAA